MIIRRAKIIDIPRISEIMINSWRNNFKNVIPTDFLELMSEEIISKSLSESIKKNTIFVAIDSDRIVGFIGFGNNRIEQCPRWELEIQSIHVEYDKKGQGIGSQILDVVFNEIKKLNIQIVGLSVFKDNPANKFYKKHGGYLVGEQEKVLAGQIIVENLYEFNLS